VCVAADGATDGDAALGECLDQCPADPEKVAPGACGCGRVDEDLDGDAVAECPLAHWALDGNASDRVGGFDGDELNGVTYVPGRSGQAADLSADGGNKAHIRVASDAPDATTPGTLNPDSVSLSLWMRGTGSPATPFERGRPCLNYYGLRLVGTTLHGEFNPGTNWCSSMISVSAPIDTSAWQHIVFTVERSANRTQISLRLYVNGVLAASGDAPGSFPNDTGDQLRPLVMGRNYIEATGGTDSVQPFYGQLDDVRIYPGALSPSQAAGLYASY
jgi:hypothetical protein